MARDLLFLGPLATGALSIAKVEAAGGDFGPDGCADWTSWIASVARAGRLGGGGESARSVAFAASETFNLGAFLAGKLRAAGGLIKPTPAENVEKRPNRELGGSTVWVMV